MPFTKLKVFITTLLKLLTPRKIYYGEQNGVERGGTFLQIKVIYILTQLHQAQCSQKNYSHEVEQKLLIKCSYNVYFLKQLA